LALRMPRAVRFRHGVAFLDRPIYTSRRGCDEYRRTAEARQLALGEHGHAGADVACRGIVDDDEIRVVAGSCSGARIRRMDDPCPLRLWNRAQPAVTDEGVRAGGV
jgi:hypothetical protein